MCECRTNPLVIEYQRGVAQGEYNAMQEALAMMRRFLPEKSGEIDQIAKRARQQFDLQAKAIGEAEILHLAQRPGR